MRWVGMCCDSCDGYANPQHECLEAVEQRESDVQQLGGLLLWTQGRARCRRARWDHPGGMEDVVILVPEVISLQTSFKQVKIWDVDGCKTLHESRISSILQISYLCLEYQNIVNVASALYILTQKCSWKVGTMMFIHVHFCFHIHYQQVFRNKVDDPKFRCYLTLAFVKGDTKLKRKRCGASCAPRCFSSSPSMWIALLSYQSGANEQWSKSRLVVVLPSYIGIIISHYKDPYQPTTMMECQKGFEHFWNDLYIFLQDLWLLDASGLELFFESFLVGWCKVRPRHWYQERGLAVSFNKAAANPETYHIYIAIRLQSGINSEHINWTYFPNFWLWHPFLCYLLSPFFPQNCWQNFHESFTLLTTPEVKTFFTMMSTNDSEVSSEFHGVTSDKPS